MNKSFSVFLLLVFFASSVLGTINIRVLYPNVAGIYVGPSTRIDFNLMADTNVLVRNLLIDINFSSLNSNGTGTIVLNDGNFLVTSGLSCDAGTDVNVVNDHNRTCHYVWDSTSLPSGAWYVLLSDQNSTNPIGFDSSDFAIQRGNDSGIPQAEFATFSFYVLSGILAILVGVMAVLFVKGRG